MPASLEFFARCASGFEGVLARELKDMRLRQVRPLKGGVAFFGDVQAAYRACLWSRVATRVQLVIARVGARDAAELYENVVRLPWEAHVREGATIAVQAHGENPNLRNTQFTALKVKDALCDRLREARGARPDVDAADPDFALDVSLHASKATLYLNLSGASLHRRGYREEGVQTTAPLKETLAAGMLLAAGWQDIVRSARKDAAAADPARAADVAEGDDVPDGGSKAAHSATARAGAAFLDPMCGSGTLAIEAALIAADIAPGIARSRWGFQGWAQHDSQVWTRLAEEADARERSGRNAAVRIYAGDTDKQALALARANAERASVDDLIVFRACDAAEWGARPPVSTGGGAAAARAGGTWPAAGLLAVNPPYGHRLQAAGGLPVAYEALSQTVDSLPEGWRVAAITPDSSLDTALGMATDEALACYNGPLEVAIRLYTAHPSQRVRLDVASLSGVPHKVPVAERNSEQFAARLRKAAKERAKWARKAGVSCYRVYDSDLPDYAVAVDVYEGAGPDEGQRFARVAEYKAPTTVDAERAARRFADAMALVPAVLDVEPAHVFSKVRRRAQGGGQYREARDASYVAYTQEGGYLLEVDLTGYLDTGLFLDHRTTRQMVGQMATGKHFLNLFAYTGVATVHAAGGKAATTTTVDLSQTYLAWAQRNMEANGFTGRAHRYFRDDVQGWLYDEARYGDRYDLVFCDPPTFSNSKAMGSRSFEVQRDHVELLESVADVLAPGGIIVFSCNKRGFKLDAERLSAYGLEAEVITPQTIPHDFERTPKVHCCYLLRWAREGHLA